MKLKLSPKNPRIVLDENNNEVFIFTGTHLEDLRLLLVRINKVEEQHYSKSTVAI